MERYKILIKLARCYATGFESHKSFAPDMLVHCITAIENELDIWLDSSLTPIQKLQWFECL